MSIHASPFRNTTGIRSTSRCAHPLVAANRLIFVDPAFLLLNSGLVGFPFGFGRLGDGTLGTPRLAAIAGT